MGIKLEVEIFSIAVIIFSLLYMFIFYKKGVNRTVGGYIRALYNCFIYAVAGLFFVVGLLLTKLAISEGQYVIIIIPLVWLFIEYSLVKKGLLTDFNLDISINIIKIDYVKKQNIMGIIISGLLTLMMFFVACVLFIAIFDTENQGYGPIPLILVDILLWMVVVILFRIFQFKILNRNIIDVFKSKMFIYIAYSVFVIFGLTFISVGIISNFNNKDDDSLKVQGKYIGKEFAGYDNENDSEMYYLIYEYVVEEKRYTVTTNYSTSKLPYYGDEKTIYYDLENPSNGHVDSSSSDYFIIIFGVVFMIIPTILLKTAWLKNNNGGNQNEKDINYISS